MPMVYANRKHAYLKLDLTKLKNYDFWLAEYNDTRQHIGIIIRCGSIRALGKLMA